MTGSSRLPPGSAFHRLVSLLLGIAKDARDRREWEKADLIRDRLRGMGIEVKYGVTLMGLGRGVEWFRSPGTGDDNWYAWDFIPDSEAP